MREDPRLRFAVLDRLDPPPGLWEVAVARSRAPVRATVPRTGRRLRWIVIAAAVVVGIGAVVAVMSTSGGSNASPHRSAIQAPEFAHANLPYRAGGGVGGSPGVPFVNAHLPVVNGIAAAGTSAWLVGATNLDTGRAITWHWLHGRWVRVRIRGALPQSMLWAVSSLTADEAWAVGSWGTTFTRANGTQGSNVYPLVEHWNGAAWARVPVRLPMQGELRSVVVVSDSDVWAVGDASVGHQGTYQEIPYAIHWDGRTWSRVNLPLTSDITDLVTVSASGPRNVWVLAEHAGTTPFHSFVVRYDGRRWRRMPSPFGPSDIPRALVAHSPHDVWAVGSFSDSACPMRAHSHSLAARWDGHRWHITPSPSVGTDSEFGGLAFSADGRPWAFGSAAEMSITSSTCRDTEHTRATIITRGVSDIIERWSGGRWYVVASRLTGSEYLLGATASPTAVWALSREQYPDANAPVVLRYSHHKWVRTPVPR